MKVVKSLIKCLFLMTLLGHAYANAAEEKIAEGLKAVSEKRFAEAVQIFAKSFENGKPEAGFYLGRMSEVGTGVQVDKLNAVALYKQAAEMGSAKAFNRLGIMHYLGDSGVLQNYDLAIENLCKAAELGYSEAMYNCAELSIDSKKHTFDKKKALKYYVKAANIDHIASINKLGDLYKAGELVEKNNDKATQYFKLAAGLGNAYGLFSYAKTLEQGEGTKKDLISAHVYYNLATKAGHPKGNESLDRVGPLLDAKQLARAQKLAVAWKVTPAKTL
jgi:TPR repeat protein